MNINLSHPVFRMAPRERMVLDDACGSRIVCRSGFLWITLDGDPEDYFLGAGDALVVQGSGRAVLEADKATELAIEAYERSPCAGPWRSRFAKWFTSLRSPSRIRLTALRAM